MTGDHVLQMGHHRRRENPYRYLYTLTYPEIPDPINHIGPEWQQVRSLMNLGSSR